MLSNLFRRRGNYPPIEHRPAGWRPWEDEDPQPRARVPWVLLSTIFACACFPMMMATGWYGYSAVQPEPTATMTFTPSPTLIVTYTPTMTATATATNPPPTATMTATATATNPPPTATATNTLPPPTATATATITPTFTPTPERGIVSRGPAVNLRGGPGTIYDIRTTLETGTVFQIVSFQTDGDGFVWYEVLVDGGAKQGATGWLRDDLMETIQ